LPSAPMFSPPPVLESVTTYAGDCATPKTDFSVGDTVCVQTSNVSVNTFFPHLLALVNANSTVVFFANITSDPQTKSFVVPATSQVGAVTVDNRGTWHAFVLNPFFFFQETAATFTLSDPANATADVGVVTTADASEVQAGSQVSFHLQ